MGKIDFVLLWVDGSDENWIREKIKYDDSTVDYASCAARYRDWDILQYWFRGVEKYAPWVNNVYFITWGHLPKWLNTSHPRLKIVKHTDYMPKEYLPTFNSNPIELNLHRIPELSETFVLFNDDMFLINPLKKEDVFREGLPVDEFEFNVSVPNSDLPIIAHTNINNLAIINKHFKKKAVVKKNFSKIITPAYKSKLFRTLLLMPWGGFAGIFNPHLPQPHLKSTFAKLWETEGESLDETCRNKFRTYGDLNHWLMRYWNLCSGDFHKRKINFGKMMIVSDSKLGAITQYIRNSDGRMICFNDSNVDFDFENAKKSIGAALQEKLPDKSEFEL